MAIMHVRIKELRNKRGFTLAQVADFLNVTEATAQRYETGKGIKSIPYEVIEKYANMFNCSPSYIMGWDREESITEEIKKDNDIMSDIIVRMRIDKDFLSVVETLNKLEEDKFKLIKQMLNAFNK